MSSEVNRRFFIKSCLNSLGVLSAGAALSSCSTIDNFLFEDAYDLKDQTLIIGGGIAGLYTAYKMKQLKMDFKLFEGSHRFGGRILSVQQNDLGASQFSSNDKIFNKLIKDLKISYQSKENSELFIENGMETVINTLLNRVTGLMPYHFFRLRWQLVSIKKLNNKFEVIFKTPEGRRIFSVSKIILALPPTQWKSINGLLDLDEMAIPKLWLNNLDVKNCIRVFFPLPTEFKKNLVTHKLISSKKNVSHVDQISKFNINQVLQNETVFRQNFKKNKEFLNVEIDIISSALKKSLTVQEINKLIIERLNWPQSYQSNLNMTLKNLTADHYFDWKSNELIQGAFFTNSIEWKPMLDSQLQIVGDFALSNENASELNRIEGALLSAEKALSYL